MFFSRIEETIHTILEKDPAARSTLEVVLCYPGFHAVTVHMLTHWLYERKCYTFARWISQVTRIYTGIEINPGAVVGRRVFFDHGMGVVVGETAIIGDDCVIYQGVTLGAGASARMGAASRGTKRHPTLGRGVIVGSNAEVQGDITLGDNVRVASGSIVLKDVPANSVVVGVPGRVIYRDGQRIKDEVPDIEAEAIKSLKDHISRLEQEMKQLTAAVTSGKAPEPEPQLDAESNGTEQALDPVDVFLHGAGI